MPFFCEYRDRMIRSSALPRGQREIDRLPRFGLTKFAHRFPNETKEIAIDVGGDIRESMFSSSDLSKLERVNQVSDFHCVTTWTKRAVSWGGVRFADFYEELVLTRVRREPYPEFVVFRGQDGYRVGMQLDDLLAPDVLLADRLEGQALPIAHGAPLRLVAPAHYGYKSIKHIAGIDFWNKEHKYRRAAFKFMDHPRARVKHEERGVILPGWILRRLYRPLVGSTIRKFEEALADHVAVTKNSNDR